MNKMIQFLWMTSSNNAMFSIQFNYITIMQPKPIRFIATMPTAITKWVWTKLLFIYYYLYFLLQKMA